MLNFYKSHKLSSVVLGAITGIYLGLIFMVFNEKILNIHFLDLGQIGSFLGGVFSPVLFIFITVQHFSQQKQILDAKKIEIEKEEEKTRLAQPLFEFRNCYFSLIDDFPSGDCFNLLTFKIINHLADVTDVYIKIISRDKKINAVTGKVKKIFRGEEEAICLRFESFEENNFNISISYYDSLRILRKKSYKCVIDRSHLDQDNTQFHSEDMYGIDVCEVEDGH